MRILVSNDDGVYSPGIAALARAASEFGEVRVVAPDVEQSSAGHSITATRPVRYRPTAILEGIEAYRVNGTPADCVALGVFLWEKVDVVLSGINLGANLGNATWHSGTLAAAKQATLLGAPRDRAQRAGRGRAGGPLHDRAVAPPRARGRPRRELPAGSSTSTSRATRAGFAGRRRRSTATTARSFPERTRADDPSTGSPSCHSTGTAREPISGRSRTTSSRSLHSGSTSPIATRSRALARTARSKTFRRA